MFQDKDVFVDLVKTRPTAYAFGVEYGRKTILGPVTLGAQWCNLTGFSFALSVGFDF